MNFSYSYRPLYLLAFGIEFIIICVPSFIFLTIGIFNNFNGNLAMKDQIFLIVILIGMSLIISYGGYNIFHGRHQFKIQFSETNFKSYKDLKLEQNTSIEKIERIHITQGEIFFLIYGGFKYFEFNVEIEGMDKFQLTIRGKKWISKFYEFIELLEQFCDKNHIQLSLP